MKFLLALLPVSLGVSALIWSCGGGGSGGSNDGGGSTPAAWTNKEMQSLVTNRCANAGCHDGTVSPSYKGISEANMKSDSKALSQVTAGLMPKGSSLSATELATFKAFYGK